MPGHIIRLATPIFLAELVNVTYNIVDRMFIGHIPSTGTLALSGVGVAFPLISFINAFAGFVSSGGAPLFSIKRGEGDEKSAEKILETSMTFLLLVSALLMALLYSLMGVVLPIMGADDTTFAFAKSYFSIYLIGTPFVLISLGANPFITAQGHAVVGMTTVLLGAALNIILDPIFIFLLGMGVTGAAAATVISQAASALWVVAFLMRGEEIKLRRLGISYGHLKKILKLGIAGFSFKVTNSLTQGVANITLRLYGGAEGALYIGAMSIINSMREVVALPISAISSSSQPVMGYNYGAKLNSRVKKTIESLMVMCFSYGILSWGIMMILPKFFISIFTPDETLVSLTVPLMRIYFAAFFCMSFQNSGQNTFVALNCARRAVFFSLFRKVVLVVPFTLILPIVLGVRGVFWAEALSQAIGGTACMTTMLITVYRKVRKTKDGVKAEI
ncbi:MAG: MATE family efflux transporter [Candidatus Ornithospirochaeta sp.]